MSPPTVMFRVVIWLLLAGIYVGSLVVLALPLVAPDYSRSSWTWNKEYRHSLDNSLISSSPQILTASDLGKSDVASQQRRHEDAYGMLSGCYQGLLGSSLELSRLSGDVPGLEDLLVNNLKLYQSNVLCVRTSLDYLGRNRGLDNYNPNNGLETVLKDIVNLHKDTLAHVSRLVYEIPALGPVVGPVVYDIKCLIDKVLDAVENVSDALISQLGPLLANSSLDTLRVACKSGLSLLGICI